MKEINLCSLNELEHKNPIGRQINGLDLVIVKYEENVSVLYGRCLHRGALDIDFDFLGITQEQFVQNASEVIIECEQIGWSLSNYNNSNLSSEVIEILSRIDQAFQQSTYADESEIDLLTLKDEVSQTFRCSEYNILMGTIEIALYSNCIWGPSRNYVKNHTHSLRDSFGWDWNGAAAGDTAASASYFMGLGSGVAFLGATPGSNAVLLGGWAITAGLGSLWGGVKNLGGTGGDGDPPHTKKACP